MDTYIHTILATGCLAGAYYVGRYISNRNLPENIVSAMLEKLEKDGFISTTIDKDGDKELIPVSELIAKALRESKKMSKKIKKT
jgi:DNA-binding MarR family transcriptional regulator